MTPSELSDLLWAQVDRVAPHLLPNGKKEGHEWVAGNVNGDKGNSLKVNLSGKKKWADFAEGDGGDMLDLWMACRGINLHQAMQEAKAFLGIKDDDHHFDAKREKKFSRPDRKKIARYVTRTESHLEYLQSRGISPEVVKRYEVVSGKVWNGERELDALVLPYKRDGELLQVKRISTERPDGKKVIMAEGDCEPCLFGWQALDAGVRAVVLCEGEIDCMSYAQYGISALSASGLQVGDAFTIAGVNSVHQITKDTTGQPQVFRVLAVSGTTVTISPKILPVENTDVASRPYANVDAKPAESAAITILNKNAAPANLFWADGSVELMYGKLAFPTGQGPQVMTATTEQGATLIMSYAFDHIKGVTTARFTTLYGCSVLVPEYTGIVIAGQ